MSTLAALAAPFPLRAAHRRNANLLRSISHPRCTYTHTRADCTPALCACGRRRKTREAKQYSKQVQAEKQKERNATKKRQIESVSNLRKQREKSVSAVAVAAALPVCTKHP